jgi:hypothetical protein
MNNPDSAEQVSAHLSEGLLLKLEARKRNIAADVSPLLESGSIDSENDRRLVREARDFVENPGEDIERIKRHTTMVGMVSSGYDMQGADVPPALDALHAYLSSLQCVNRIKFIEEELDKGNTDSPEFKLALAQILDWATNLSRGYKDNTMLDAVNELQERLGNL